MADRNYLLEGFVEAIQLLIQLDPEIIQIILLSLYVSGIATIIASLLGIPLGAIITIKMFPGREVLRNITYTLMGLPSVVAGLIVLLLLSHSGPLGFLDLLYTPNAIIIAQFVLALPVVMAITMSAVSSVSKDIRDTAISLGANEWQVVKTILWESRNGIITAFITTLSTCISEVGAAMMVGGNIRYVTRVLTTATVLNTSLGNYGFAMALGLVLLIITFLINLILLRFQNRKGTVGEVRFKQNRNNHRKILLIQGRSAK